MLILINLSLLALLRAEVIQVQSLFRHGAREIIYPEYHLEHISSTGELTAVGMRQHYNLGAYLRKKYLLQNEDYDAKTIHVRSTSYNRTLQSVQSQLQGLYPKGPKMLAVEQSMLLPPGVKTDILKGYNYALPNDMQVVPIHTVQCDHDTLLRAYSAKVCPINAVWSALYINSQPYKEHTASIKEAVDWVQHRFNVHFNESQDIPGEVAKVFDNYMADKFQGKRWDIDEQSSLFKQLEYNFIFSELYTTWNDQNQISLFSSQLLETMVANMQSLIKGENTKKLHLFSAHDSTVLSLMRAFNMTSWQCQQHKYLNHTSSQYKYCYDFPPFASNMILELHRQPAHYPSTSQYAYSVKVLYNGDVIQVCGDKNLCPIDQFIELQKKFYLANFDSVCHNKAFSALSMTSQKEKVHIHLILALLIAFAVLIVVKMLCELRKMENQSNNYHVQVNV